MMQAEPVTLFSAGDGVLYEGKEGDVKACFSTYVSPTTFYFEILRCITVGRH